MKIHMDLKKIFEKIIVYTFIILFPLLLVNCQGWLAPNIGAF